MAVGCDYHEDLPRIAVETLGLADRFCCPACHEMHALWPFIRLAGPWLGGEASSPRLVSALADSFAEGRRTVLIAGAADTGLLALTARAGGTHCPDIAVLDRCATRLEACRLLAARWGLPIETMQADMTELDPPARFDVVLVHGTLHFIPTDRRADALARLRRAMRPDGRLVLRFNAGGARVRALAPADLDRYADRVLDALGRLAVPLPEEREALRARLRTYAQFREERDGTLGDPADIRAALTRSGFAVRDWCEFGVEPGPQQAAGSKRRFPRSRRAGLSRSILTEGPQTSATSRSDERVRGIRRYSPVSAQPMSSRNAR